MTYQGRSQDDLPLAAYSTGAVPDEPEEADVPETPHLSQQDVIAMAMGIQPAATAETAPTPEAVATPRARRSMPRPSLPRLSLPRPSLRLPSFGGRGHSVAAEAPFRMQAQAGPAVAQAAAPASATFAMPLAQAPVARPAVPGVPRPRGLKLGGPGLGGLGTSLRNPRVAARDPRVLFGGVIAIGVVVLGVGLLGGGGSSGGVVPGASASARPGVGVPAAPGPATIAVAGDFVATFNLTGTVGTGKPADGNLLATWDDGAGSSVTLTGRVGGTRTTSPELTLAITVMRNEAPVTFTSEAGECTIGMAEKLLNVSGTFVCPKITSNGGRYTVKLTGTYST